MPRDILFKKKILIYKGNIKVTPIPKNFQWFPIVIAADKRFKNLERLFRNCKGINNLKFR